MPAFHTSQVPAALELWNRGDASARASLVTYAAERLERLAQAMLRSNPVRHWENADDLLQQALVRLHRSLDRATPRDARALLELAALEMRHALIDLARHYFGPLGVGANQQGGGDVQNALVAEKAAPTDADPADMLVRAESMQRLYTAIDALPAEEREVIDLVWIHELSHAEAAAVLGVALKTVGRRSRRARLRLFQALGETTAQV